MGGSHALFRNLPAIFILTLVSLVAFWPVLDGDFINLDDGTYVTENPRVLNGVTWGGLRWAATARHAANWHPLTWVSHMADVQLFGLQARGHHLVNLLLHIANSVLLFAVLAGMTGTRWRSFFVAALFAVHPVHVESVAWVAERKDVLSTFFWMLTMVSYLRFVRRPRVRRYLPVFAFLACGLMSKPMLVTLPFVLLLLDYWPLGRLSGDRRSAAAKPARFFVWNSASRVVLEKAPLFALSAASSVITYLAQKAGGAVAALEKLPLAQRASEALLAYLGYLEKAVWPRDLSVIYTSTTTTWPDWRIVVSLVVVGSISWLSIRLSGRNPSLFVGWYWYLGTLVPVIGIVKIGAQAMADRYTYVPLIGLFVMVVWNVCAGEQGRAFRKAFLGILGSGVLVSFIVLSRLQAGHWKDSVTLFGQTLAVSPDNWVAHHMYALALAKQGRYSEAISHSLEAVRINFDEEQLDKLGDYLEVRGKNGEAAMLYSGALRLYPDAVNLRYRLANALNKRGDYGEAIPHYQRVIQANPNHGYAQNNLAIALFRMGKVDEAIAQYREALRVNPRNAEAHNNLGYALRGQGHKSEAEAHYLEAWRSQPNKVTALRNLADLLQEEGRADEAASWRRKAREIENDGLKARDELNKRHWGNDGPGDGVR